MQNQEGGASATVSNALTMPRQLQLIFDFDFQTFITKSKPVHRTSGSREYQTYTARIYSAQTLRLNGHLLSGRAKRIKSSALVLSSEG